jgi:hypothetical protein
MESSKVYVNVMAEFTNDGRLLPRSFIWKDGHVYEIQQLQCRRTKIRTFRKIYRMK